MPKVPQVRNSQGETRPRQLVQNPNSHPQVLLPQNKLEPCWGGQDSASTTVHLQVLLSLLQLTSHCLRASSDAWSRLCLGVSTRCLRSSSPPKMEEGLKSCRSLSLVRSLQNVLYSIAFSYKPCTVCLSLRSLRSHLPAKLLLLKSLPQGLLLEHHIQSGSSQRGLPWPPSAPWPHYSISSLLVGKFYLFRICLPTTHTYPHPK